MKFPKIKKLYYIDNYNYLYMFVLLKICIYKFKIRKLSLQKRKTWYFLIIQYLVKMYKQFNYYAFIG